VLFSVLYFFELPSYHAMLILVPAASNELRRYHPDYFESGWSPPSSYASVHEQKLTRGLKVGQQVAMQSETSKQKKVALLVNEGTASSAELFASTLRDNGRVVALVGAKTYGKGLIQVRKDVIYR
jgi:hypothetical protein